MKDFKFTLIPFFTIFLLLTKMGNTQSFGENLLQRTALNVSIGLANYGGELQERRVTFREANIAAGVGMTYALTNHFKLRGELMYGKIGGDDRLQNKESLKARNLNFKANLYEISAGLQYDLFDVEEKRFTPYIFGGIAFFHANPYTIDEMGNKQYLARLATEGQGLPQYPDKKPYNTKNISIPMGGGLNMLVNDVIGISFEAGFRKTFTDYIDDVSGTYADFNTLNAYNPLSAQLAFRANEIDKTAQYPADGTMRGNPKTKDYYYFGLVKLHVNLNILAKNKVGCPTRIR